MYGLAYSTVRHSWHCITGLGMQQEALGCIRPGALEGIVQECKKQSRSSNNFMVRHTNTIQYTISYTQTHFRKTRVRVTYSRKYKLKRHQLERYIHACSKSLQLERNKSSKEISNWKGHKAIGHYYSLLGQDKLMA